MISGHADVQTAVEATQLGAFDFVQKPFNAKKMFISLRNAVERRELVSQADRLKRKLNKLHALVGESPAMSKVRDSIDRIAPTDARVLISGSNGTGKELAARWLHEKSPRREGPFVAINCAAIPGELIESELFGHEKGAFTGAQKQYVGRFEQANGGTLFLDEIGDMSLNAQAKMLRVLQENSIARLGGSREIALNVRLISASNKDLPGEIAAGNFRDDLYHRLSVLIIHMPSLAQRREDIPELIGFLLEEIAQDHGKRPPELSQTAIARLVSLEWKGNVRELRNVLERIAILGGDKITEPALNELIDVGAEKNKDHSIYDRFDKLQAFRDYTEKKFIKAKLGKADWNISHAASLLGIQRCHLYNKINKYEIKRP
jgi:DNA-binding NtrC family response regulator